MAPMCQYSAGPDGLPTDWHLVHLGTRAVGGAGLVMTEATAVLPEGRISPQDTGLWSDAHVDAWRPVTAFVAAQGAVPACSSRTPGSRRPPTGRGRRERGGVPDAEGGWTPVGPGAEPFVPATGRRPALDEAGIAGGGRGVRGRPPIARWTPASRPWRSTPRTATCCTSSSRR